MSSIHWYTTLLWYGQNSRFPLGQCWGLAAFDADLYPDYSSLYLVRTDCMLLPEPRVVPSVHSVDERLRQAKVCCLGVGLSAP